MFYDFLKLMFVCKETNKKTIIHNFNFNFVAITNKRNAPFTLSKFYIAYIEQVLNEKFTSLNVASKSKLYFIHDIMNNICHNKQQK
jgi:hypothetical protein